jgi:alkylation response protein AidB-like acyl-CoA dehydrogenase
LTIENYQLKIAMSLTELSELARKADEERVWPAASWKILQAIGACGWTIPKLHGGEQLDGVELLERYESLAEACLTSAFLLSQRDAAVRRLRDHGNESLCRGLLPALATGERFATVGLAQLTTSRQHGQPAVTARDLGDSFIIDGTIPWVTGAPRADHIVIGAVVEGAGQILAVLPTDLAGVSVGRLLELMALEGSITAEIRCEQVRLPRKWLLAGPVERVMQTGKGGTGGLETSCLALGLAGAAITQLRKEAELRSDLLRDVERLNKSRQHLVQEMHQLAAGSALAVAPQLLRARVNTLVLQATQATLTACKGTGFLRSHPAQRWARQALFFLVWSCPWPVAAATMQYLTGTEPENCVL